MTETTIDLQELASEFFRLPPSRLPDSTEDIERALIAETVRLALSDKTQDNGSWDPVHVLGLRHWTLRKLRSVLGDLQEDGKDLFREALDEGERPGLVFLGDIIELREGYYSPAPSRAIMTDETTAALISGLPTYRLSKLGSSLRVAGISRILEDTSRRELKELGIPVQERNAYIGIRDGGFGRQFLENLIEHRERQQWAPREGWTTYQGARGGYGLDWGRKRGKEVVLPEGVISLWREQEEYGPDQYWLKLVGKSGDEDSEMLKVPSRFFKYVYLNIDNIAGSPREVTFEKREEGIRVTSNFSPPAPPFRWLHAVGASYEGFQEDERVLAWVVDKQHHRSTMKVFDTLPVQIKERK